MPSLNPALSVASSAYDSKLCLYNYSEAWARPLRLALSRARDGGAALGIGMGGDSITEGVNPPTTAPALVNYALRVRQTLGSVLPGTPGVNEILMADSALATDTRFSGSFPNFTAISGLGPAGFILGSANGGTTRSTFTPTESFDRVKITYLINNTGTDGFPTVDFDGGSAQTSPTISATGIFTTTFSTTLGTHTIGFTGLSSKQTRVLGVEWWSSASAPVIRVGKVGVGGLPSTGWIDSGAATNTLNEIFDATFGLDLWSLMIGTNDANYLGGYASPASAATFQTRITTFVAAAAAAGKQVLLITPPPFPAANAAIYAGYYGGVGSAYYNVADAYPNTCAILDLGKRYTSVVASQGVLGTDQHLTAAGYRDVASAICGVLRLALT